MAESAVARIKEIIKTVMKEKGSEAFNDKAKKKKNYICMPHKFLLFSFCSSTMTWTSPIFYEIELLMSFTR